MDQIRRRAFLVAARALLAGSPARARVDLTVHFRTAKGSGVTLPCSILQRADQVIE